MYCYVDEFIRHATNKRVVILREHVAKYLFVNSHLCIFSRFDFISRVRCSYLHVFVGHMLIFYNFMQSNPNIRWIIHKKNLNLDYLCLRSI